MQRAKLPRLGFGTAGRQDAGADPLADATFYRNILSRRFFAWLADMVIVFVLMGGAFFILLLTKAISLGLLALPVSLGFLAVPVIYYTATLGGPHSATPGMRMMGIELRSWDNRKPDHLQALLRTLLHYATVVLLSPLAMVVVLFNERRRALHDYLSGSVVVNGPSEARPGGAIVDNAAKAHRRR